MPFFPFPNLGSDILASFLWLYYDQPHVLRWSKRDWRQQDPDGDAITLTIDGITQDEPTNDTGDGDTSPDGDGVGTDTAQIRAERSDDGDGRVYEISFTADDGNGGMCTGSVSVGVPHDKKDTAVDSGQNFDSTLQNLLFFFFILNYLVILL